MSDYTIHYADFHVKAMHGIEDCRYSKEFADAKLISEDGEIFDVHRVVMAAQSSFLRGLFNKLGSSTAIYLSSIKSKPMKLLLEFMYSGSADVPADMLAPFISAAEALNIRGLVDKSDALLGAVSDSPSTQTSRA